MGQAGSLRRVGNPPGNAGRRGVTLLEMLIVVAIIATIAGISYPSLTAGLAGVRLASSAGSVASFLTSSMNFVDRREQPAAVLISPGENTLDMYTAASADKPKTRLTMPAGITIEGDEPRRFMLFPGGAFPRITVILRSEKGGRRSVQIDPVTAVPKIQRVEAEAR